MHGNGVKTDPHGTLLELLSIHARRAHSRTHTRPPPSATAAWLTPWMLRVLPGNLFEGEWRDGKPIVKNGDRVAGAGPLDWLNEAVANVSTNLSGQGDRGNYATVSTHDDDDDDWRRPNR